MSSTDPKASPSEGLIGRLLGFGQRAAGALAAALVLGGVATGLAGLEAGWWVGGAVAVLGGGAALLKATVFA